jgi:large subunit ribosomal protein L25
MAETLTIQAEPRQELGSRVARRLRRGGRIPCVMLHKRDQPLNLLVNAREFERALHKGARILDLAHPSGRDKVFIKSVQWDPLGERILHVDFAKIAMDELITLEVELVLKGKPVGVTEEGAALDQYVKTLKVQCLPTAIPERIEADVTPLKKDETLKIKDIKAPAGVKLLQEPDVVVAIVQEHKVEEIVPAAAAAAPAEPEVIKEKKVEEGEEKPEKGEKPEKAEKKEAAPKAEKKEEKK